MFTLYTSELFKLCIFQVEIFFTVIMIELHIAIGSHGSRKHETQIIHFTVQYIVENELW